MSTNDIVVIFCFMGAMISVFVIMSKLTVITKLHSESTDKLVDMIHKQNLMIGEVKNIMTFIAKNGGAFAKD